jgi:hypothetical protein
VADVAKLRLVLKYIEEELAKEAAPSSATRAAGWDQAWWGVSRSDLAVEPRWDTCGTAFCFAGWTAVLDGVQPLWERVVLSNGEQVWACTDIRHGNGQCDPVELHAQDSLGLTGEQADNLFFADNTIDDLRRIVQEIIEAEEARHA